MIPLGFSAGLPFLLVFSTLTVWLAESGLSRLAIGFFAWVGITYSIKVVWAPVVDSLALGPLTKLLGRRRSWILLGQFGVVIGLVMMALLGPQNIFFFSLAALLVAFFSATQDVSIDAYRIEAAIIDHQGAMTAAYVFGYRLALLVSGAGALYAADFFSWQIAYFIMAAFMFVGIFTILSAEEPSSPASSAKVDYSLGLYERIRFALVKPISNFFQRYGNYAFGILLFVAIFRLSDITMGIMANPFFIDLGYTKTDIANIAKLYGFFMTILGAFVCGILVVRSSLFIPLFFGGIAVCLSNLLFAFLAGIEPEISYLVMIISFDNFSGGFASTAFIAYLSSLTDRSYTATQYALFSSLMTLPGKFFSGFSGLLVELLGYETFFVLSSLVGLPGVLMVVWLFSVRSKMVSRSQ